MDARLVRADLAIVGAGAAGLSLLVHLGHAGWRGTVVVVDDGAAPLEGRGWAWWSAGDGLLDRHADAAYGSVRVAGEGWSRTLGLSPSWYLTIRGTTLHGLATDPAASVHAMDWVRGTATGARPHRDGVEVDVRAPDGGRVLVRAPRVYDSVGLGDPAHAWGPRLDFLGWQVRTERDQFSVEEMTFMDFRTGQDDGVAFMHVLPSSPRTALVERTVYAMRRTARDIVHEPHLRRYLDEVLGASGFSQIGEERGIIPLAAARTASRTAGLVPIGAPAGAVKASTGYAFARIQRHSARIAAQIVTDDARGPVAGAARSREVPGPASSRWYRALDGALLTALREDPDGARRVLEALLRQATPAQLLSFLDEDLPRGQQLSQGARLPFWVFPRASLRRAAGSLRR